MKRKRVQKAPRVYQAADDGRGWMNIWSGGGYTPWQMTQGFQLDIDTCPQRLQSNWAVFACQTLIAGDIGKLGVCFYELIDGVWQESVSDYDRLLRRPNGFQTGQQFRESWTYSKQRRGNTYALLERDLATRVRAMYVLDPDMVTPLIAPDGSVYYRLSNDDLAGIPDGDVVVPGSEIIHDRFNCLFHPLIGLSPLYASALAAVGGLTMQEQVQLFHQNGSRPGGLLTTPGTLTPDAQKLYKQEWETNFAGINRGRTAVLGNGLKYEAIRENAVDSELIALLNMSARMVCSTHHVPAYKVGVGEIPIQSAAEVLNQVYYDTCLQQHLEAMEALLDDALGLYNVDGRRLRTQFDLNDLIRMDGAKRTEKLKNEVGAGITSPDEARAELGRGSVPGGRYPYLQQQNYSLEALAKRDAGDDPFGTAKPTAPAANEDDVEPTADQKAAFVAIATKAAMKETHAY